MSYTRGRPTETDDEGRPQPPSRPATSTQPRAFLEIRLQGGAASRRILTESHLVIGRVPGVQLLLDHHTVSRRHAEMFCDPFGRFWIRDLGSTNGTLIGDDLITERVLSPGDRVVVGDFSLTFDVEGPDSSRDGLDLAPLEDEQPTAIRTLIDLEPPRISAGHLRTLLELSRRLLTVAEPRDRVDTLAELVVRGDFHGLMAVVLRSDGRKSRMLSRPRWCGAPEGLSAADARQMISRRVLETLHTTREPLLATNAAIAIASSAPASARFEGNSVEMSLGGVGELYVIAVPFPCRSDESSFDALYVTVPRDCWTAEWLNLYALAVEVYRQGETTWKARMDEQANKAIDHELQTARQIQRGLLPAAYTGTGLDVEVGFQPCRWVGGDYVDVVPLPSGRVLLAVADVCGKGLQAAMVGSSLHTMVRATADVDPPLTELMERVNRHLCEWLPEHSFVTMVAAVIDPATGAIECVNAGHPPVIVARADGGITELQAAENPALGIAETRMASQRARLEPGDLLTMYTDGLSELTNPEGEMLGHERLAEEVARISEMRRGEGLAAVGKHLDVMLDAFRGDQVPVDDRTYLLAQRL